MKDLLEVYMNPRFWMAYIGFSFPMLGCLIAGGYLIAKEKINDFLRRFEKGE